MATALKVVMIYPTAPKEILALLRDYLRHTEDSMPYVHGVSVDVGMHFVEISLVTDRSDPDPWPVQIPVSYIAAILDMSKRPNAPGFISQS